MGLETILTIIWQAIVAIATGIYIFFSMIISFIIAVFEGLFM